MSFISFSLNYYKGEIQQLEASAVSQETIYHAKQLLKMLDDLLDEGYTELNETLEKDCQGVSRLRDYLQKNGACPFPACRKTITEADVRYEHEDIELTKGINKLIICSKESPKESENSFLAELKNFCEWIGYEEATAYIFLLRDTLLPYIYYLHKDRASIYPWLIGRKTLTMLTGKEFVDDELRACIIKALEIDKCDNFNDFCKVVLPDMRTVVSRYPDIEEHLIDLLNTIKEKNIVVIESGCSGTFPMLLKCLDKRVDIRMYTTYPYLKKVYGDKIYSDKYEENRLFETLYSQDLLFQFSALRDNHFYVKKTDNREISENSYAEIRTILK